MSLSNTLISIILLLTIILSTSCDQQDTPNTSNNLIIAVSIQPQAWLVKQIAGHDANIITLVQPGQSPATYQPTDKQISDLMGADILLRIGVPFERGQWYNAIENSPELKIVDQRQNITLKNIQRNKNNHDQHNHSALDPHIWLSPPLLKIQARTITDALIKLKPESKEQYLENYQNLCSRLDNLHQKIAENLASLTSRSFIVFHPAWGYFADAYNLEQIAIEIQGKQPTDHELTILQQTAKDQNIKVIFVQPQIASHAAKAVADTIDAKIQILDPMAYNVIDNLLMVSYAIAENSK